MARLIHLINEKATNAITEITSYGCQYKYKSIKKQRKEIEFHKEKIKIEMKSTGLEHQLLHKDFLLFLLFSFTLALGTLRLHKMPDLQKFHWLAQNSALMENENNKDIRKVQSS